MTSFKLALTAGHYKYTAGKRCLKSLDPNETREWVLNDRIADKVETLLAANYTGFEMLRTDDTTGETGNTLDERTGLANNWGADFYLSIHHNAGINGGKGGGIMAYVYTNASAESMEWQKALYDALIEATGLAGNRSQPLAKANLHECRETNMPAVLLELGFMDSATDVPVILSEVFADQCAGAIVKVLAERGKLTKKKRQEQKPDAPDRTQYDLILPELHKGDRGEHVKAVQQLLIAKGYTCGSAGADGIYGDATENALLLYQEDHGLDPNAIVGPATMGSLLGS